MVNMHIPNYLHTATLIKNMHIVYFERPAYAFVSC